jgi:hypothetical protein
VPAYAVLEPADPDVTVGDIQAAETLLALLLEGIADALAIDSTLDVGNSGTTGAGQHA